MKTFVLWRDKDPSGVSGTGKVAEGVMFTDGTCAVHWLSIVTSTSIYPTFEHVVEIHGHNGKTRIEFD